VFGSLFLPVVALISIVLTWGLDAATPNWAYGLPGMIYLLLISLFLIRYWKRGEELRSRAELGLPAS
jgi:uncharacterized membrane protein